MLNMTRDLEGKKVLVTSASSGIGLATVETLARRGATVALNYLPKDPRDTSKIVEHLNKEGLSVRGAPGDVSLPDEVQSMVQETIQTFGGLDYLINNAGVPCTREPIPNSDLERLTEDFWHAILTTNLIARFVAQRQRQRLSGSREVPL